MYHLLSWNINRYDDQIHNWLKEFIELNSPDVIFLSETKLKQEVLEKYLSELENYAYLINIHQPAHYHGVAFLIRKDHTFTQYTVSLNIPTRKDTKGGDSGSGRILAIELDSKFFVVGTYSPNSGVGKIPLQNLDYRINHWDQALYSALNQFKQINPTIWLGDINVAPTELDVSPSYKKRIAGFTIEERNSLNNFLQKDNWVDIWRFQHPNERMYSWTTNYSNKPHGMRLDNIIITPDLTDKVTSSYILQNSTVSSDHVPIGIYLNF